MSGSRPHQSFNPLFPADLRRLNNRCIIYEKSAQSSRVTVSNVWKLFVAQGLDRVEFGGFHGRPKSEEDTNENRKAKGDNDR